MTINAYDNKLASADGTVDDVLAEQIGKVTLVFNVSAGCGNIPQHAILQELNERYEDEPDFDIIAVVCEDFSCHGYPEFENGLEAFANLPGNEDYIGLTPGEIAKKYAADNYGTTYEFTENTLGRYDKHTYDPEWRPGEHREQDPHPLWKDLTGESEAEVREDGVPHHWEASVWAEEPQEIDYSKKGFVSLTGNFDKFLIDRNGKPVRRYANGFLLGERDHEGHTFSWFPEKYKADGRRDHTPTNGDPKDARGIRGLDYEAKGKHEAFAGEEGPFEESDAKRAAELGVPHFWGPWPSPVQRKGIDLSLEQICEDIDTFLAS